MKTTVNTYQTLSAGTKIKEALVCAAKQKRMKTTATAANVCLPAARVAV